jgi:hemin uptake protein HemP
MNQSKSDLKPEEPTGGEQSQEGKVPDSLPIQSIQSDSLPKIISFDSLARCGEEIWIENNGQIYRLRRTKQGKLILTK